MAAGVVVVLVVALVVGLFLAFRDDDGGKDCDAGSYPAVRVDACS